MTNYLLAFLYSSIGLFVAAVEVFRMRASRPFDALSLFNGAYFLFFVFVPLNVLVLGEDAVRQKYAYQTWSHGDMGTALALLLSYAAFVLGFYKRSEIRCAGGVTSAQQATRIASWLAGMYFGVGIIALAYHISLVGGLIETLQLAPGVRTGEFQLYGRFLFIRQFCYFLATAFMLYWAVYMDEAQTTARTSHLQGYLMLVLLGFTFVYYASSTFGRREFIYPMIICLFIWVMAGRRRVWGGLALLLALCVLWFGAHPWINYSYVPPTVTAPTVTVFFCVTVTSG